jgi:hypothetical protein
MNDQYKYEQWILNRLNQMSRNLFEKTEDEFNSNSSILTNRIPSKIRRILRIRLASNSREDNWGETIKFNSSIVCISKKLYDRKKKV